MTASGLPINGANPNSPLRLFNVGPATFLRPIKAVRTRAIAPLPPRVGPTIRRILCRSVRPLLKATLKFPASREKNREFSQIRALGTILKADTRANSKATSEIPYATEQGIISAEQGILVQEQGFC